MMTADQIRSLQPALAALLERFRPCFKRGSTFGHWERYLLGARFGAFEVRTYTSLIRHWLCSAMVMYFLASQTQRLREKKSTHHT